MLRKVIKLITGVDPASAAQRILPVSPLQQHLADHHGKVSKEAAVGATVLGPIPAGHRREFFCYDEHTWIWYEEWTDAATGARKHMTVRYEVLPHGILKVIDGVAKGYLKGEELDRLMRATHTYYQRVATEVYGRQFAAA